MPGRAHVFLVLVGLLVGATRLPAASSMPGLLGVVYDDPTMTRPDTSMTFTGLDDRQAGWPAYSDWGLRLRGYLTSPVAGHVTIRIQTNQRVRLLLQGRVILNVTNGEGTAEAEFRADIGVPLILEYSQAARPSHLQVFWQLPGREMEAVPAAALSHDQSDLEAIAAEGIKPSEQTLLLVANPDPHRLPSLSVWRRQEELLVGATFPNLPGFTCDSWCYESAMEFLSCRDLGGGRLELRHRLNAYPAVLVVTDITPEDGALEFQARLEREDGAAGPLPANPLVPNLCWQLKRAPAFASRPEPYPAFIGRCFIFTRQGLAFLDHTVRRKIPVQPADDPRNNPPWVQIYGPAWEPPQRAGPNSWSDYSPDRFTCSVIGTVSRDRKHLAAIATGSADTMCQAWHDCMHINSRWEPVGAPPSKQTWRLKIYLMLNDPALLLRKVAADFPEIRGQPAFAATPDGG